MEGGGQVTALGWERRVLHPSRPSGEVMDLGPLAESVGLGD